MATGTLAAWGHAGPEASAPWPLVGIALVLGPIGAAVLNAASNTLNQIHDLAQDRLNKPERPIPSGRIGTTVAGHLAWAEYACAIAIAACLGPWTAALFAAAGILTWIYSAPPLRSRNSWWGGLLTIAVARGLLLKLAGWSALGSLSDPDPWFLGLVAASFLLGAAASKDFSDMAGDRAAGVSSLPIRFGPRRAAWLITPSFVLPFLLLAAGPWFGWCGGSPWVFAALGVGLSAWGAKAAWALLHEPEAALAGSENHPTWRDMYGMMFVFQVGTALAYAL